MKLTTQTPKHALNKAFLKQPVNRDEIDLFKANLQTLLFKINENETEEHHKNFVRDFLKDTFYKTDYEINTKGRQDLVIHVGKDASDNVGVILEAKKPTNKTDMISADNPNKKALHELVLYYLNERNEADNFELKNLVITDIYQWFIFDANLFDKQIYRNTNIKRLYQTYKTDKKDNPFFYGELQKIIANLDEEIVCTYFDIRDYETALKNDDLKDDESLIELFKILSPPHLLKVSFADDSNKLDKNFYTELLHIIGLEEIKDKSKLKIQRKDEARRDAGSLIENTITIIKTEDLLPNVENIEIYGETREERIFNIALDLCLTWINRVLFLKLLEAQLVDYHNGNRDYRFLDAETIKDFDGLYRLFHQVLAINFGERISQVKEKFRRVPYLNSSLFEFTDLERQTLKINSLNDTETLNLINTTVLKEIRNQQGELPTLEYLFKFLDAYDFASEGREGITEKNRSLINASVLGKVFEKINGYKDGSIYTPGFITMYMCRQAIRLAVVQKFKDAYGWNISEFTDIKNYLADYRSTDKIKEFNALINSLHLCDPAVGSGHFLVSSLNEIIAIKSELGILADENGERFRDIEITIENDELTVFDTERNEFFKYRITNGKPNSKEAQRLQKTLFHEKQTLIENCLFGVDINPNSVKICRLRLWIELLKNAYYKDVLSSNFSLPASRFADAENADEARRHAEARTQNFSELETLPNIDINIKEGNSLLSRFALDADLSRILKQIKYGIEDYRNFVLGYKETRDREKKREFEAKIKQIKDEFKTQLFFFSPERRKLADLENQLKASESKQFLFGETDEEKAARFKDEETLKAKIAKAKETVKQIEENAIYKNAFEWRFEFPEVLDNDGNFTGFDIVIGNPPYISIQDLFGINKNATKYYAENYQTAKSGNFDIYLPFIEKSLSLIDKVGVVDFIMPNVWIYSDYGKTLRKWVIENQLLNRFLDFGSTQVFDEATIYTACQQFSHKKKDFLLFQKIDAQKFDELSDYSKLDYQDFSSEIWSFSDEKTFSLKNKISSLGQSLGEIAQIFVGIQTSADIVYHLEKIKDGTYFSKSLKKEVELEDSIMKPLITGIDAKRYKIPSTKKHLLHPYFTCESIELFSKEKMESDFPKAWKYFKENEVFLRARENKKMDKDNWYAYIYPKNLDKQNFVKIGVAQTVTDLQCFLDEKGEFFLNNVRVNGIKPFEPENNNIKYLLAIMNSKVANFFFKQIAKPKANGFYEANKQFISPIPIKQIEEKDQQPFVALVDQILELKKEGKDTQALENEIDALVYRLYDLTDDEIKIVKGTA